MPPSREGLTSKLEGNRTSDSEILALRQPRAANENLSQSVGEAVGDGEGEHQSHSHAIAMW